MTWDTSKWTLQNLNSNPKTEKRKNEYRGQRQYLINSSDNDTDDEEWIQQLERDYGKRQQKKAKWTRLEKVLVAILFSCLIVVSLLITSLCYSRYKHGETLLEFTLGGQKFCNERACVETSHRVFTYMDEITNPCDDFYKYACGTWLKTTDIPSTHTKWNSFAEVSDRNQKRLKQILDNLKLDSDNSDAIQKVGKFYKACQRKDFIEKTANQSLIDLINYVGSWAVTNKSLWNEELWNFGQALSRIHHLKSMPLFYMYVAADDKNSSRNIIQIEQSGVTLSDDGVYKRDEKDKIVTAYKKLLITVALLLGGKQDNVVQQTNEIFEFEKKLSQIFEKKEHTKQSDQIYHKMTVAELLSLAPALDAFIKRFVVLPPPMIPWLDYMNSMFSDPVKASEEVVVYTPKYLKNMSDLVIATERRIIANYMVWHLIKPILVLLSKPYRTAALELSSKEIGTKGFEESWKNCITKTDSVLGFATGHLFVKDIQRSGDSSKHGVDQMLLRVKEEFIANIRRVEWMDKITKERAVDKAIMHARDILSKGGLKPRIWLPTLAGSILNMVGYPDWIMDTKKLGSYYEGFTITDDPLRNFFNAREFYHEKTMKRRGQSVQRNEWHMTPTEVNAYYNAPNNYIGGSHLFALPLGILQAPFYDVKSPMAMNFGALGTVIGHELTHGFDSQGKHFDKTGNLHNWWSNSSTAAFFNKTRCLQNQYGKYNDQNVTSNLNVAENIADNGGMKVAFNAFKSNEYKHGVDKSLPGMTLNPDQLFFIGFAQAWCSLATPEKRKLSATIDVHSSEKARVNVVVSNSKKFSKAFKCPENSPMNPSVKCAVW